MTQQIPISIDVTDLPEYGEAMRQYRIAKGEAEAKGDEIGVLRAESEWQRTLGGLKDRKYAALQHRDQLERVRAEAATQFPKVKPELYGHIDNPDQVLAYAKQIQESIDEAAGTPSEGQSWGGQAPTSAAVTPPAAAETVTPRSPEPEQFQRIQELAPTVYAKGRKAIAENAELRSLAAAPILNRIIDNASASAKINLETGEPL